MLNKWEGIVLKSMPYGESNKIVTLYTREAGKMTAMARGAKKPASRLSAVTQTFTYGYYLLRTGRGMGTLEQGEPIDSMRHIREDLEATAYASYIVELIDRLTDDRGQVQTFLVCSMMHFMQSMNNMILKQSRCLLNGRCCPLRVCILSFINVQIAERLRVNLLFPSRKSAFFVIDVSKSIRILSGLHRLNSG